MRRTSVVVGMVAVAIFVPRLDAQGPPDLSGKWLLTSSQPPEYQALGRDFSISQDATTLRVDSTAYHMGISTNGTSSRTPFPIQTIYTFDGMEHPRHVLPDTPARSSSTPTSGMTSDLEESIYKAGWAGRQLVIVTYNKYKISAPGQTPSAYELRQTVRQALSMEADGTLAVESLIVADPSPVWHAEMPSPTPVRSIYKRQ
jgi:hypothetical protein